MLIAVPNAFRLGASCAGHGSTAGALIRLCVGGDGEDPLDAFQVRRRHVLEAFDELCPDLIRWRVAASKWY